MIGLGLSKPQRGEARGLREEGFFVDTIEGELPPGEIEKMKRMLKEL